MGKIPHFGQEKILNQTQVFDLGFVWRSGRDSLAPKHSLCDRPGRYDSILYCQLRRQYSLNFSCAVCPPVRIPLCFDLPQNTKNTPFKCVFCIWRSGRDSNPRANLMANAFRVRPVMTASIPLLVFYVAFLIRLFYYIVFTLVCQCFYYRFLFVLRRSLLF